MRTIGSETNADYDLTSEVTVHTVTPDTNNPVKVYAHIVLGDGVKDLDGNGGDFLITIEVGNVSIDGGPMIKTLGTKVRAIVQSDEFVVPTNQGVIIRVKSPNSADTDVDVTVQLYDSSLINATSAISLGDILDGTGGTGLTLDNITITGGSGNAIDLTPSSTGHGILINGGSSSGRCIEMNSPGDHGVFISAANDGIAISAVNGITAGSFFGSLTGDGSGLSNLAVDVTKVHGSALTETTPGNLAANYSTFYDNADSLTGKVVDNVGGTILVGPTKFFSVGSSLTNSTEVNTHTATQARDGTSWIITPTLLNAGEYATLDFTTDPVTTDAEDLTIDIGLSAGGQRFIDVEVEDKDNPGTFDFLGKLLNTGGGISTFNLVLQPQHTNNTTGAVTLRFASTNLSVGDDIIIEYATVIGITDTGEIPSAAEIAIEVDKLQSTNHGDGNWEGDILISTFVASVDVTFPARVFTLATGPDQDDLLVGYLVSIKNSGDEIDSTICVSYNGTTKVVVLAKALDFDITAGDEVDVRLSTVNTSISDVLGVSGAITANTATLDTRDTSADTTYVGRRIQWVTGGSTGESGYITSQVSGVVTVSSNWVTLPVAADVYVINPSVRFDPTSETVNVGEWIGTAVTLSTSTNKPEVDLFSLQASTVVVTNIRNQYDGATGLTGDLFPATQAQIGNVASGSGGLKKASSGVVITTGTESSGTVTDTESLDGIVHTIVDAAGTTDFYYQFNVGVTGVATSFIWDGYVQGNLDEVTVYYFDWTSTTFKEMGTISGANGTTIVAIPFDVPLGGTDENGDVRFRLASINASNTSTDRIWVEYTNVASTAVVFNSGTAQGGSANTIQIEDGAVTIDNKFVRSKVILIAGTGSGQEAIITDSDSATDILTVKHSWLTNPDNTTQYAVIPGQGHSTTRNGAYDGVVFFATGGNTGTLINVNGISSDPVGDEADAYTIADDIEVNTNRFSVETGSTFTLPSDSTNKQFNGAGWTLVLDGQTVAGMRIDGANFVSGVGIGVGASYFNVAFGNVTLARCSGLTVGFGAAGGIFTMSDVGPFIIGNCGAVTTTTPAVFDFNSIAATLDLRDWSGHCEIRNAPIGSVLLLDGNGDLTIAATCNSAMTVILAGGFKTINNAGVTITEGSNVIAQIDALNDVSTVEINAELVDVIDVELLVAGVPITEALRRIGTITSGEVEDAKTGTETFIPWDGVSGTIVITVDPSGNRTGITYN